MAKKKLKTMNEISAAEAVKLFHAAISIDYEGRDDFGCVNREGFPRDIAARDFLEQLNLYREMWLDERYQDHIIPWGEQRDELVKAAANIPADELEQIFDSLTPAQKRVYIAVRDNPNLTNKQIAGLAELHISPKTLQVHLEMICAAFDVKKRRELFVARPKTS